MIMFSNVYVTVLLLIQVESLVDLCEIARETDGFSGSDLREMCRDAALLCVRDCVRNSSASSGDR